MLHSDTLVMRERTVVKQIRFESLLNYRSLFHEASDLIRDYFLEFQLLATTQQSSFWARAARLGIFFCRLGFWCMLSLGYRSVDCDDLLAEVKNAPKTQARLQNYSIAQLRLVFSCSCFL